MGCVSQKRRKKVQSESDFDSTPFETQNHQNKAKGTSKIPFESPPLLVQSEIIQENGGPPIADQTTLKPIAVDKREEDKKEAGLQVDRNEKNARVKVDYPSQAFQNSKATEEETKREEKLEHEREPNGNKEEKEGVELKEDKMVNVSLVQYQVSEMNERNSEAGMLIIANEKERENNSNESKGNLGLEAVPGVISSSEKIIERTNSEQPAKRLEGSETKKEEEPLKISDLAEEDSRFT